MAITLTVEDLTGVLRVFDSDADTLAYFGHLLAVCSAVVSDYAPDAPDAVQNEAVIRLGGHLAGSGFGGIQSETIGPRTVNYATNHAAAFRYSGAAGLLTRYKKRRAGILGGPQPQPRPDPDPDLADRVKAVEERLQGDVVTWGGS